MDKVLVLADDWNSTFVAETVAAVKSQAEVLTLGGAQDEETVRACDLCLVINAYINGTALKVAELLMNLDKPILAFPSDPWKYLGKGTNFLIQTGNAQLVTCMDDIFSYLTPVISSKSETRNS